MNITRLLTFSLLIAYFPSLMAEITPREVYSVVRRTAAEVDLIRMEMGITHIARSDLAITDAQPREVYFQALTMVEKSNRLLFQQLRERENLPPSLSYGNTTEDVMHVVEKSLRLLMRVKESLKIPEQIILDPMTDELTPTDVYKLIVSVNRSINELLIEEFSPADVFEKLTYGIGLTSEVLLHVTGDSSLDYQPEYQRKKTPRDVYILTISIYTMVHNILKDAGQNCLSINPAEYDRIDLKPSDVYDMATLLISQLNYLQGLIPGIRNSRGTFYPGDKLPSHAFQRAQRLENQVKNLRNYSLDHPDWLQQQ